MAKKLSNGLNLKKPPPHVEGYLHLENVASVGKRWKKVYLMVLRDTIHFYEHEDKRYEGSDFKRLTLSKHCDIFEYVSRSPPRGCAADNCFSISSPAEQLYFACKNKKDFLEWVANLQYVQRYWLKRYEAQQIKESKLHDSAVHVHDSIASDSEGMMLNLNVTLNDGKIAVLKLPQTAKYHEFFAEINKDSACPDCFTCQMREQSGKLFVVDSKGRDSLVTRDELLLPHYQASSLFFFLEHHQKVLVVFFTDGCYIPIPLAPKTTVKEIFEMKKIKNAYINRGIENPGLFLHTPEEGESLFNSDECPLPIFYARRVVSWERKPDVKGRLVLKDQSISEPVTTFLEDDDVLARSQLHDAKKRTQIKQQDEARAQIDELLRARKKSPDGPPPILSSSLPASRSIPMFPSRLPSDDSQSMVLNMSENTTRGSDSFLSVRSEPSDDTHFRSRSGRLVDGSRPIVKSPRTDRRQLKTNGSSFVCESETVSNTDAETELADSETESADGEAEPAEGKTRSIVQRVSFPNPIVSRETTCAELLDGEIKTTSVKSMNKSDNDCHASFSESFVERKDNAGHIIKAENSSYGESDDYNSNNLIQTLAVQKPSITVANDLSIADTCSRTKAEASSDNPYLGACGMIDSMPACLGADVQIEQSANPGSNANHASEVNLTASNEEAANTRLSNIVLQQHSAEGFDSKGISAERGTTSNGQTMVSDISDCASMKSDGQNSFSVELSNTQEGAKSVHLPEHQEITALPAVGITGVPRTTPDVQRRSLPICTLCSSLTGQKPFPVTSYNLMTHQVLVCCSRPGDDPNTANDKDYICLMDVHLRNTSGLWEAVDSSDVLHELEDSWDAYTQNGDTSSEDDRPISRPAKPAKKVPLNGGIICKWISTGSGVRGKWHVYKRKPAMELPIQAIPTPVSVEVNLVTPIAFSSVETEIVQVKIDELMLPSDEDDDEDSLDGGSFPGLPDRNLQSDRNGPSDTIDAKLKETAGQVISTAREKLSDWRKVVEQRLTPQPMSELSFYPRDAVIPDELLTIRELCFNPLKDAVLKIVNHFKEATDHTQHTTLADDHTNEKIGWLVRGDFCTAVAGLLLMGLKSPNSKLHFLFGKPPSFSLWEVLKAFSRAFPDEPAFGNIVHGITECKTLFSDDMKFRYFVCEMLNASSLDGSDKLIVTWFRRFPMCAMQLEKYYQEKSFWRMRYCMAFELLMEELILILKQLNGWPFGLHVEFEYEYLQQRQSSSSNRVS